MTARDRYPTERPDAVLENSAEAVRAFGPPAHVEVLLLKPAHVFELTSGKLVAYTTGQGDTILLAYDE